MNLKTHWIGYLYFGICLVVIAGLFALKYYFGANFEACGWPMCGG